ncbi:glycosyltransferase family protein [Bacillus sp. E214]|uniref:glycosyltransferase family protein n=1 Tax=Bacillus sp. E214 TaxID=2587156 RepID=UPI0011E07050|nr:glycosyltransferase family protein [Bacillus sp. E214]
MKTIAYYISDYGYGHASRSIAVIRELLKDPKVSIIVCHSFAHNFIKSSIQNKRVTYKIIQTDIGYFLKENSIYPDKRLLFREYKSYLLDWETKVKEESDFLEINNVRLVISDISPLGIEAANKLSIPSIGISNFTWYTAYQELIEEQDLQPFKEAYQKMDHYFSLAGSQEPWNSKVQDYGFFSRAIDEKEVNRIQQLINPTGNNNIVFLGLGMKIDLDLLESLPIWDSPNVSFIVSTNVKVIRENVYQVPIDYIETQNYIAASNLVISKAGWGMIGEALCSNTPLLLVNRQSMREDQNTIQYLKERNLCKTIEWDDFKSFEVDSEFIKGLYESTNIRDNKFSNEASRVAKGILKLLKS